MYSDWQIFVMNQFRPFVLIAPISLLFAGVLASLIDLAAFLSAVTAANSWILTHFSQLFNMGSFLFVLTLVFVWFSPLGLVRIGGEKALPLMNRWNWFAITLCTTIAIGILFWATAEPLYHYHQPPISGGVAPASEEAKRFAISSLFMHWSITPYAIYTVPSLAFALAYHNHGKSYSLAAVVSLVVPAASGPKMRNIIDATALFALVAGISANLGIGILSISRGIATLSGIEADSWLLALVAASIVGAFMLSSLSGLMRGIRLLSDWNTKFFFLLCTVLFFAGPTGEIIASGAQGLLDYAVEFLPRSVGAGVTGDPEWAGSWTTFYWANWLAWAPVTALFLGRISIGYTVREFIVFNLILPASFAIVWMSIFGASAIEIDRAGGALYSALQSEGPEAVIYQLFETLPLSVVWSVGFILLSFICFVTAADSNTQAIAGLCQKEQKHENIAEEDRRPATLKLKIVWASVIGLTAWIMVTFSGVDGVRMLSNLGGLPALFIVLLSGAGLVLMATRNLPDLKK